MKTLHLTNSWHETSGGIATFYRALMEEANRRGSQMRLVVPADHDWVEEVGDYGRIYHVAARASWFNAKYRTIYPTQFLFPGSKLQNILAFERPDLVEICDKYTLNYLGGLLRMKFLPGLDFRPVVVGLSCERMDDNFLSYLGNLPFAHQFCSWYMRWIYFALLDHHITNSEYTAAELRPASRGHIVRRGTWIRPMGVDLSHLSPNRRCEAMRLRLLQNFGATEKSTLLLYAGRLVPEKNLLLLFDLVRHLSKNSRYDFRLLVVGDGIERAHWEKECAQKIPGRAVFLGHIHDRNVLADLLANCDLFVHPNPREPFGIAPLEAMASGLPAIVPNTGGVTSYASMENAWAVEPTVESFAAAVEEAVGNNKLRQERTARALAKAQQYRWERVAASFFDLYADLHCAVKGQSKVDLRPDFWSAPAVRTQKLLIDGVSQFIGKTFLFTSRLFSKPGGGTNAQGVNSAGAAGC